MIVMTDILKIIQQRQSTRVPYDPNRPMAKEDLKQIIEAGRWAPIPFYARSLLKTHAW